MWANSWLKTGLVKANPEYAKFSRRAQRRLWLLSFALDPSLGRRWTPLLADDRYFSFRSLLEGVDESSFAVEVLEGHLVRGDREAAEAVDLLAVGAALRWIDLEVVEICATAAGEEVGCGVAFEFEVLEIVVVPGEVGVHAVCAEERVPVADEHLVIAVRPVGEDRMMRDRHCERGGAWLFQFTFEP